MTDKRIFSWRALVIGITAVAILSVLYLKSEIVNIDLHNTILSDIRRIKQYDATLNEDILRTRHSLLTHYDSLVTTQAVISSILAELRTDKMQAYLQAQDPAVLSQLKQVELTLKQKNDQLEQFKSENSILKNSLDYFPLAAVDLLQHLDRRRDVLLENQVNDLLRAVLMFNLTHRLELAVEIERTLGLIETQEARIPETLREQVKLVAEHAQSIMLHKARIDVTLAQISATKLNDQLDALMSTYQAAYQAALRTQNLYRLLLYAFALTLLAYVIYTLLRLKLSTQALGNANTQLVSEIDVRKQAEARLLLYREVITRANDAIALLDATFHFQEQNAAHQALLGYSDEALKGRAFAELIDDASNQTIVSAVMKHGHYRCDLQIKRDDQRRVEVELSLFRIDDERGNPLCYVSVQRDISDRKAHFTALEYQAMHDSLTGLPNRNYLYKRMDETLHGGEEKQVALLIVDLDRFKEINDTLGHYAGDTVLKQIGPRLDHLLRNRGVVARLGGDEFAIMLREVESAEAILRIASQVLNTIREPFDLTGFRAEIGASIGISLYPEHGNTTSQLMRCADVAMYIAKNQGNGYTLYDADLDEHSPRRLTLMTGLNNAIQNNQLILHYQPKLNLSDRSVIGVEALVRWQHPEHGMVPPDQFIPLAEVSDLIRPLTFWVMNKALEQCRCWLDAGIWTRIAVNFSARNFQDKDLPERIAELLLKHGVAAEQLELEITESAVMSDPTRALAVLQRIHQMGITLSIDDYGTGYSSLSYLQQLPIRTLKIDLSFVREMLTNHENEVIVQSTITLAHNLGLNVVAEGVENIETLNRLTELQCDHAQGYFISRPMDATAATQWLHQNK